jgi:predicted transposase/invertase (TIGR01784 family)
MANEPAVDNIHERQIRFDISCRAQDGELINVEMTLNPDKAETVRLEYYAGKLFTGQDIRGSGKRFGDLKSTYQISFIVNRPLFGDESFLHEFEYYDRGRGVSLGGRSHIITVELGKLEGVVEKAVGEMTVQEEWLVFFRYLSDKGKRGKINEIVKREEGIAMAGRMLLSISRDEDARARLMSEYKYEVDMQSKLVDARLDGLEEGMVKGREEGLVEGQIKTENKFIELLKSGKSLEEILQLYSNK